MNCLEIWKHYNPEKKLFAKIYQLKENYERHNEGQFLAKKIII